MQSDEGLKKPVDSIDSVDCAQVISTEATTLADPATTTANTTNTVLKSKVGDVLNEKPPKKQRNLLMYQPKQFNSTTPVDLGAECEHRSLSTDGNKKGKSIV